MRDGPKRDFDLVVVGAGSAGFAAAIRGAELGARVALVEGGALGGTCVNVGCVPSKTLIRAAEAAHRRAHHGFAGIPTAHGPPEWPMVRDQKDELVADLRDAKYADVLLSYDAVTLVRGRATLATNPSVETGNGRETGGSTAAPSVALDDGRRLTAPKLIVATGSSPWAPPIPGLCDSNYLDSTSAMALERLPESMIVIGGSTVGLELAQMFGRLGVRVTVLEQLPRVMPAEAAGLGEALARYLIDEGVDIYTAARVRGVERRSGYTVELEVRGESRQISAERLLVAAGRRANSDRLGLEQAGVVLGAKGEVCVDDHLKTSNPNIYAAGDVTGDPMFVYVAAYAGSTAAENALEGDTRKYDLTAVPRVTFTDPAVASVGLTAEQARARSLRPSGPEPLHEYVSATRRHDSGCFSRALRDASAAIARCANANPLQDGVAASG